MISVIQLGTVDYATGLALQQQLVALRKEEKIDDVLLLLEHKPVVTLGRNAKAQNVVASPESLKQRGVELFECDRGGDVTFHGPGQIVGYPIFDLRGFHLSSRAEPRPCPEQPTTGRAPNGDPVFPAGKHIGVIDFVRRLEDVLIRTCADFGIPTKRVPGLTGVWTDPETGNNHVETAASAVPRTRSEAKGSGPYQDSEAKLAAIGVHISRFVTSHGFALNVNTDLTYFNLIVPCGITTKPVTSMQKELGRELDLNTVSESISCNFGTVFQSQMLWVETLDAVLCSDGSPIRVP